MSYGMSLGAAEGFQRPVPEPYGYTITGGGGGNPDFSRVEGTNNNNNNNNLSPRLPSPPRRCSTTHRSLRESC